MDEFEQLVKMENDPTKIKPVVVISVDGGPDENPRYQKVIDVGVHHCLTYDLDCMFIVTNGIYFIQKYFSLKINIFCIL